MQLVNARWGTFRGSVIPLAIALSAACGRIDFEAGDPTLPAGDGGVLEDASLPIVSPWWNPRWTRRQRLSIRYHTPHRTGAVAPLLDFPLLVVLRPDRFDYRSAAAWGEDLRFISGDGHTVLPHEIESWNDGGDSYVWVRAPALVPSSPPHDIWLYYGNPQAYPPTGSTRVWGDAYVGVWHLTHLTDSTPHANDGRGTGTGPVHATIAYGRALRSDGSSVQVPDAPSLRAMVDGLTVSAWVRVTARRAGRRAVISRAQPSDRHHSGRHDVWFGLVDGSVQAVINTQTNGREGDRVSGSEVRPNDWTHVALTYDGFQTRIYLNGELDSQGTVFGALQHSREPFYLGAHADCDYGADGGWLHGDLDEVRIERVARSDAWMAAQHASMTDRLIQFGGVTSIR